MLFGDADVAPSEGTEGVEPLDIVKELHCVGAVVIAVVLQPDAILRVRQIEDRHQHAMLVVDGEVHDGFRKAMIDRRKAQAGFAGRVRAVAHESLRLAEARYPATTGPPLHGVAEVVALCDRFPASHQCIADKHEFGDRGVHRQLTPGIDRMHGRNAADRAEADGFGADLVAAEPPRPHSRQGDSELTSTGECWLPITSAPTRASAARWLK